jgi:hypothetical protein
MSAKTAGLPAARDNCPSPSPARGNPNLAAAQLLSLEAWEKIVAAQLAEASNRNKRQRARRWTMNVHGVGTRVGLFRPKTLYDNPILVSGWLRACSNLF